MSKLTAIILTYNEEIHIRRAIESAAQVADEVIIVDSYSTDETISIAHGLGAKVFQNQFVNYAVQYQWALDNTGIKSHWVLRLDADEYLTPALISEINERLMRVPENISGIILKRRVYFMGQWIKYGGYYPVHLLRIWRTGHARIEERWMDEHIYLTKGEAIHFKHDFIDDNQNSLSWWISKHNNYATREAIDVLNQKYGFLDIKSENEQINVGRQAARKRRYKNSIYLKLPLFFRSLLYFLYRYFIRLGFLDGRKGLVWHFLQAFWYRFLVDAKILQIEWWAKKENKSLTDVIVEKYKYKIS